MSGNGRWVEIRIIDQFNNHDILFKGKARLDREEDVDELLFNARIKGMDRVISEAERNKRFLFEE